MARNNFSLNFDGFMDLAREIDSLGDGYLQKAVENAFTKSKEYVDEEIEDAMAQSKYNFDKGQGFSQGKIKASFEEVSKMPIEWNGTTITAPIGVKTSDALEILFLIYGSPNTPKDTKLHNAIKVKGKVKKEVERIQEEEFQKVIQEAMNG